MADNAPAATSTSSTTTLDATIAKTADAIQLAAARLSSIKLFPTGSTPASAPGSAPLGVTPQPNQQIVPKPGAGSGLDMTTIGLVVAGVLALILIVRR